MPSPLLLPLALAQGLKVRLTTPRLPPAAGDSGVVGTAGPRHSVAGLGDSIIAGVGVGRIEDALLGHFARRLHERTGATTAWRAIGRNGADSRQVLDELAPRAPVADAYLLSVGVNDAVRGTGAARFAERLEQLVERLRARAPGATILFAGIPPLESFPALPWPLGAVLGERARRLQAAARASATRLGFVCFDFPPELPAGGFAADGFHPAAGAYDTWAGWLLEAWLSPPAGPASAGRAGPSPPA